jgi:uncharacterized protein (TIGR00255 family)
MIRSMTGFGTARFEAAGARFTIEIRSVNQKHADVRARLPRRLSALEPRVLAQIQAAVSRGKIDVTISAEAGADAPLSLELNEPLAAQYHAILTQLAKKFGIKGPLSLESFVALEDVVFWKEPETDVEAVWAAASVALGRALAEFNAMREAEGSALSKDLETRVGTIEAQLAIVRDLLAGALEQVRATLREKVKVLLEGAEPDPWRMEQEILFYAERMDVSEEITRLQSHVHQFRIIMASPGPVGRKLDFLVQEILRETNTIGSKANHAETSHRIVDIKAELEKIREQVQNVE